MKRAMIHHVVVTTRLKRQRDRLAFAGFDLSKIWLATPAALNEFYCADGPMGRA